MANHLQTESTSSYFTSESVSEGHPDKLADQISDGILDEILRYDPYARVACETLVKTGLVVVAGEITVQNSAKNKIKSYSDVCREVIKDVGYTDPRDGFDYRSCGIIIALDNQSLDIAQGVDANAALDKEMGAGDQGMMFGYAVNETPDLMPASISYSHNILSELSQARKTGAVNFLKPDAKTQVTVEYRSGKLHRVDTVVLSTMHTPEATQQEIKEFCVEGVIKKVIPKNLIDQNTKFYINPTGRFVTGGPHGDCGLTGRKIIVDTYGGHGAHGGGAFSGKDPSKVDRSAAYLGRYIAKNIVAANLASRVLVQIAYAIGMADPVSLNIETFGTETVDNKMIERSVWKTFKMKPAEIIAQFDLLHPEKQGFTYRQTAAYGHFGRNIFPWEKVDKIEALKNNLR